MTSQKGFTLIEAVLSMALIGVGLIGMMYAFQGASQSSITADQTVVATYLAQETLERVLSQRDADGYNTTRTSIQNNNYNQSPVNGFPNYNITTTVLEVDPDDDDNVDDFLDALPASGCARITTTITWNNGASSLQLATLITEYIP